jgi:hypothetical protein
MNRIASLAIAAAGVIHLILAPQHFGHAPAHGIFFAVAGLAQILWAVAFLRDPNQRMYYSGLVLAGGLIALWAITRFLPAPFHHHPEAIDLGGIVCKLSELVGLGALLAIAAQGGILGLGKQSLARLALIAIVIAAAFGAVSYTVGRAAEPLFPSLSADDHSDDAGDHDPEHGEGSEHEESGEAGHGHDE